MSTKLTTKTIVALASMMLACFVSIADENPYTVQYTVNGYVGTEALTNFPVLVRLAANSPVGFAYSDCASGGADLTFTDDGGNVIPREIDTWTTSGESLVWVCVPVVTNGASFTMHYGDTAVTEQPACQTNGTVWSGANYKGVWHMDSVDPADSSPNGYDGTHQTSALSVVDGALGAAVNFPRTTTGDGITCGEVLTNSELADGFTIEGWCRPTQYGGVGDGAAMFGKKDIVSLRIKTDTMVVLTTPTVANHEMSLASGVLPAVNTWWHFVATFKMNTSNDGLKFYVNGQLVKKQGADNIKDQTTATEMFIGNNQWNQAFKGDLDEIRLSAGIRSTNWVAASYATQHAADFLSAGPRVGGAAPFLAHATATPGYTDAQVSVLLASVGEGATSASVTLAYGPEGGQLSEPVVLAAAATDEQMLTTNLTGLTVGTTYRYVFTAENNLSTPQSRTAEGTFSTRPPSAPTLSFSDSQEGPNSQTVGATVTELGGASSCDLYFAYGPEGTPLAYTQVGTDLAAGATFSRLLEGLDVGTVYAYSFAVTNDLGLGTVETGTFTAGIGCVNPVHFTYRAKFTMTGYTNSTEVLENFPVLVRLAANSPEGFSYADCAEGGSDIRFSDAGGKLIPHEIETWDTAGESLIWVGLPIATNGTTFAMYYHSDAPGLPSTDDVWTDYVAVVHGGASITNSVAGGPAATAGSAAVTASSNAGKIGGGVNKSSNNSIGFNIADVASKLDNTGKYSVSAWFKRNGNGGNNNGTHILAATRSAWGSGTGFVWLQEQGKYISISAPNGNGGGTHQFSTGNHTLPNGAWAHAAFSYESGVALTTYFNGARDNQKTSDLGNLVNTSGPWTFGSYANTGSKDSFLGDMDELRIYNGVASSNRIRAEYDTMANDTFLAVSPRVVLAPFFSNAMATPAYTNAQLSVLLVTVGDGATSATVTLAYGPEGGELSAPIVLAAAATDGQTLSTNLTGLADGTTYHYLVQVVNDLDSPRTNTIEGVFTTLGYSAPELSLSTAIEGMDNQSVSACIVNLGGADTCNLYFSYGPASDPLPPYMQVGTDMAAGATFSRLLTGLQAGIAYTYSFAATNNLDLGTIVTSSFTPGVGFPRPDVNIAEFSRGVKFTVTGYTGTQELTNFPVLVRLSDNSPSGFSYADFYNPGDVAGADLCFLDAAGNGIPHEIDTWDPNGESLVWVTLSRMTNGTEFSMWYRSSKNGSVVCADNAWEDYTGVWHLGEGGDGVQTVADSTTNALDGVTHANSSAQAAGRVGGSRRVSDRGGASDANGRILVSLGDSASPKRAAVDALAATGSDKTFTASAWLRPRGGTDYAYLFSRKTDDTYPAWGVQFHNNSSEWYSKMRVYSAGQKDSESAAFNVDATGNGVWRKIDVVWTKTTYTVYYDGGAKKWTGSLNSSNGQEPLNGSSDLSFGGNTSSGYGSMNAELDEIRLRRGNMGDDWVKADYDTVNNLAFLNGGEVVALAETPKPIATLALSDTGAKYAQFSGSIGSCGGDATECTVYVKVWETADSEPVAWTLLASGLEAGDAFSGTVTGLDPETAYSYKIKAVNNLATPEDSDIESGAFTTGGTGSGGTGGERYRVGNDYVHVFEVEPGSDETSFVFTPPDYVSSIRALVVAGGGPGGFRRGGGGGAGGLVYDAALAVSGGATYAINVGTGGVASASAAAYGSNGGNSSIVGTGVNVTAVGGGAGGNGPSNGAGVAGGSGGGAGSGSTAAGAGTASQGNAGGIRGYNGNYSAGGGGGGAGRPGSDGSLDAPPSGGSGGQGFLTDISGTPTWYAGGGGGGGQQGGKAGNMSSPGGGGDGGGGRGGMAVPSGAAASFSPAAAAGQNGLGGGGGGGSDVSGFYEGGNGGNGIVIVRYTVQGSGAGSAEPVVSLTGATYAGDLKITGTYRVAWAGEGENVADVYVKWGYAANSLTHSVKVAQDAVGTGKFEIAVPVDQKTIYLRAMADNGSAQGLSDEIVPIYVPEYSGVVPGDPTIPVLGTVSLASVDGVFARLSGTVTSFGTAGAGEDPITGCEVYALVGTSDNVSRMAAQDAMPVTANEPFSLAISNLTVATTYYWCLEARNSAGVAVATQIGSFTTPPEHTVANTVSANNAQRTVALSGSLAQVGAGPTTVSVRWREGSDDWGDWTTVATFDGSSASTAFNTSHTSESWSTTISWEVSFSNQCVTAEGEPAGDPWVTTQSGTFGTGDTATYTWQAVAGDWDGSWTNAAHWACDQADRRDYPYGGTPTVAFNNNTVATIEVPGSYAINSCSMAKTGIDLTFVGEDAATSRLSGNFGGGGNLSNSSWTFSAMTFAESNGIEFGNTSTVNASLVLKDGASATMGSGGLNLIGSNVWLVVENGSSFGSRVGNCTKDGGIRLDDGTVSGTYFRTDYNWAETTNEWFIFKGAAPRLTATASFRNESATAENLQNADTTFLFSVPAAGWAESPLCAEYSSAEKFGGMLGTGEGGYVIAIDPESPAFTAGGNRIVQLVEWRSGIDTTHVRFADDLPQNATLSWTYGWPSTLAAPENEGDAPTGVKVTIVGRAKRSMILVW